MHSKLLSLVAAVVLIAACSDTTATRSDVTGSGTGNTGLSSHSGTGSMRPGSQEELASLNGRGTGDRVFFQYDRVELTPDARDTLKRQSSWLKQYGQVMVTIEGHCDERGTREYNLALGNRRATEVRNYLTALGVSPDRVAIISYGKERPAMVGDGDETWSQNRRGVTIVN
ncbi:MAG: peptidoglycan-associated lipoprotein Pal [Rhodospirillaceae bacterium]